MIEQGGNDGAEPFGTDAGIDDNAAAETEEPVVDESAISEDIAAPAFDGQQYALKYRGQTVYPESMEQLITWAQQGRNSSEKNNALNTRESELNDRAGRYEQLEALQAEFENNPSFKDKILKLRDEALSSGGGENQQQQTPDVQALVDAKVKEAMTPHLAKIEESEADKNLDVEIATLRSKYPDEQWDEKDANGKSFLWEVMNHAFQNNHPNLEVAYRDYTYDNVRTNTEAETLKTAADQRVRDQKTGVVSQRGSNQMPQPKKVDVRSQSYESLGQAAAEEYAKNL